jgi:hypothetical protein
MLGIIGDHAPTEEEAMGGDLTEEPLLTDRGKPFCRETEGVPDRGSQKATSSGFLQAGFLRFKCVHNT